MGRITRAKAAEAAEQTEKTLALDTAVLEVPDENAGLLGATDKRQEGPSERAPLGDITPNASNADEEETTTTTSKKKAGKGKRGGKKKGTKGSKTATPSSAAGGIALPEVAMDDSEATSSQASDEAAEDLMKDRTKGVASQASDMAVTESTKAAIPSSTHAVKLTRSQLKNAAQLLDNSQEPPEIIELLVVEEGNCEANDYAPMEVSALDAPQSPLPSAVPNVIANLRKDQPSLRSTSNKENVEPMDRPETPRPSTAYDALEAAVVEAATPPVPAPVSLSASVSEVSLPQVQSPIEALDELEDAVEKVTAELPKMERLPPKVKSKKPTPIVRSTKASQARISMAHGEKDVKSRTSSIGKPRPSSMMGRSTSFSQSAGSRPQSSYNKRVPSNGSDKSEVAEKKKEAVIPHSKPRPISMSFPEPPKPIKSTKAPTKSTFQLPGEAVAAKLKAAREERIKKESEEAQKRASFKARPAPSFAKNAPVVRQTNSSKFRESIATGKDARTVSAELGHRRANSAAASAEKKSSGRKETTVSKTNPVKLPTRPSTSLANISKPRSPMAPEPRPTNKGTNKGKEVFNRPAMAKEQAEKEKREKEEAAKKARADAAERGRQASREWAEKQKQKKLKEIEAKQGTANAAVVA